MAAIAPEHGYMLAAENSENTHIEEQQQQKTLFTGLANSPINLKNLKEGLKEYGNRIHAKELLEGFTHGFRLGFIGKRTPQLSKNLTSVAENPTEVERKIDKELEKGRVAGPFKNLPLDNLKCSPIGLVPKKAAGEFRLIHHLSWPLGKSVNDNIDPDSCSVKYSSFDDAIVLIQQAGKNCEMAKCDIKSAFRLLPIHPEDYSLVGFSFKGQFYYDKAMPFGCSVSCATWVKFSTFIEWMVAKEAAEGLLLHYLDDYLFVGKEKSGHCEILLEAFHKVCRYLNVPIAHEKTEGPVREIIFLGLKINSELQTITIPKEKIIEIQEKIGNILAKPKVTLKQLQSVIGSLNFACRAVAPGRAFLRRLIGSTIPLKAPHHVTRVNKSIRGDLNMWLDFLKNYNGVSIFRDQVEVSNQDLEFFTDAAASIGMGIYMNGKWTQAKWGDNFKEETKGNNITFLEYFPILVALHMFGNEIKNKKVMFHCDNAAVVEIINKQTSKCPRVMDLVRPLVLKCMELNTVIRAKHIKGVNNTIADAISRFNTQIFREHAPLADLLPTPIPPNLWLL